MAIVCAACGGPIVDRTLLSVLDRFWHTACLNCSYCGLRLDELGPSVFVRENMLLCRQDYLRLFGLSGTCAKCRQKIPPDELVMRCQDNVYHMNCFSCVQCHTPLHPGDKVCAVNGSLFCEHEFPQLFPPSHCMPTISVANLKGPRLTSQLLSSASASLSSSTHSVSGSTQSVELVRGLVVQKTLSQNSGRSTHTMNTATGGGGGGGGGCPNRSSPNQSQLAGALDSSCSQSMSGMDIPYSIMPITQSELAAAMNSHPSSPSFPFNGGAANISNHGFVDRSPAPTPGICLSDQYPDSGPPAFNGGELMNQPTAQTMSTEKSGKMPGSTNSSTDPPTGRKKQKKVDSRRCPPLRVC